MISNLAQIHPSAKISENVTIGAFSIIGENVEIGEGTEVKPNSFIKGPCKIGKNNTIYQFASIGEDPQDLKFGGEISELEIGDNNIFREYCSINRGTKNGNLKTIIGNDNLFMISSHVAHDCKIGNNNVFGVGCGLAGHVKIGNYITLNGYTMISQFLSIGSYAYTSMGSGIIKNIPPFIRVQGNPCKILDVNKVGMKRNGFSDDEIKEVRKIFNLLTNRGVKIKDLISHSESHLVGTKMDIFTDFVQKYSQNKFGVIRK